MKLWMLGSGSRGNALLIESGDVRVLIDCGFSPSELKRRLRPTGVSPEAIDAVIITHEHTDHLRGAARAARRWHWPVYASAGTTSAAGSLTSAGVRAFDSGATLTFGSLDLQTIRTSHDAADPIALIATARASGARIGIAYDLGMATPSLRRAFTHLDLLVLEANHDDEMLRHGPYPPFLQRRIASSSGHLSNGACAAIARDCVHRGLQEIVLAHLSEKCNTPALALQAVGSAVVGTRFRGRVSTAKQDGMVGPFTPRASGAAPSTQLSLTL